jgi:predicted nucleotidyltransferase component of viral defense system
VISRAAILERAHEWQLTAEVVEKDYVLGWMLAGLAQHPEIAATWVFKGGTCLKKCIMETYRFSEDLDFTLLATAVYDADGIGDQLKEVAASVTELCGIQFPLGEIRVRPRLDRSGARTFEAILGYVGPLVMPGPPKIRFDLTGNEPVLRPSEEREVFHPYPDALPLGLRVRSYAQSELVVEKTRALVERTRPRDLYDVVLLGPTSFVREDLHALRALATQKFGVKNIAIPSVGEVVALATESGELASEWENMLGHQLPALPSLADFLSRLPDAIQWLDESRAVPERSEARLVPVPARVGEELVVARGIQTWSGGAPIEAMRFAGASHLLVEFQYHGATRQIEPYSLRRPKTGNLLIYGWEVKKDGLPTSEIRAYKVAEMHGVRVSSDSFKPRYAIELTERSGVWRW